MLDIAKLSACYEESLILQDVSLTIHNGQVACLIGRNGVGKTTLLKSIMGLVKTPSGSISLEGAEIIKMPTYRRALLGIGHVPQGRDIFPQLSVQENLLLGLERNKGKRLDESVFDLFPVLKTMLKKKGGTLSGGQQQQLAIARALVSKPQLLLLDEPTEGIQPSIIQEIARVIKALKGRGDISLLIVEQYIDFVMEVADYCYAMDKGRIVMQGKTGDLDLHHIQEQIAI